jgi:DNA-binding NarL/FixJ family response regulator
MSSDRIRVVVVEDDRAVCERIARTLERSDDVMLATVFHDAEAALVNLVEERAAVDVAVIDLVLPNMSGVELIRRLGIERADVETVVLTNAEDDASVFDALQAGASGYLLKTDGIAALHENIAVLLRGGSPKSPVIARRVIEGLRGDRGARPLGTEPTTDAGPLTEREREVLSRLARGSSYASIGRELGIGTGTVQSHIKSIYRKLGIHSRSEAVREAYRRRLR